MSVGANKMINHPQNSPAGNLPSTFQPQRRANSFQMNFYWHFCFVRGRRRERLKRKSGVTSGCLLLSLLTALLCRRRRNFQANFQTHKSVHGPRTKQEASDCGVWNEKCINWKFDATLWHFQIWDGFILSSATYFPQKTGKCNFYFESHIHLISFLFWCQISRTLPESKSPPSADI